jgi:hypothetical protein
MAGRPRRDQGASGPGPKTRRGRAAWAAQATQAAQANGERMQSSGRRRLQGSRAAAVVAAAALLAACADVSPYTERNYVRFGAPVLYSPMRTVIGDADGPFPGGSVAAGTLFQQSREHSTAMEIEYANNRLAQGGDLTGVSHGFFGGVRRVWFVDERIRPNLGWGGLWQDVHVRHNSSGSDPHGFGIYGDIGLDYMITATHSIGVRFRDMLLYDGARDHSGPRNNVEFSLVAAWRF